MIVIVSSVMVIFSKAPLYFFVQQIEESLKHSKFHEKLYKINDTDFLAVDSLYSQETLGSS
jgi:hypothetical protein